MSCFLVNNNVTSPNTNRRAVGVMPVVYVLRKKKPRHAGYLRLKRGNMGWD